VGRTVLGFPARGSPLKGSSLSTNEVRGRLLWTVGIAMATVAALGLAEWHGRSSRVAFHPPEPLARRPVASVATAAEAFTVWRGSGVSGRRLMLLTGQFGETGPAPDSTESKGAVNASNAVYWASRLGLVRAIDVVMPPADLERQRARDAPRKTFRPEVGGYRNDLHGFWLRFSLPGAVLVPEEPVLVLVEPSWFRLGASPDPLAWLSSVGVRTDLVLLARDGPGANDSDRRAAMEFLRSAHVPVLQIEGAP
jgi:hypothetical protein